MYIASDGIETLSEELGTATTGNLMLIINKYMNAGLTYIEEEREVPTYLRDSCGPLWSVRKSFGEDKNFNYYLDDFSLGIFQLSPSTHFIIEAKYDIVTPFHYKNLKIKFTECDQNDKCKIIVPKGLSSSPENVLTKQTEEKLLDISLEELGKPLDIPLDNIELGKPLDIYIPQHLEFVIPTQTTPLSITKTINTQNDFEEEFQSTIFSDILESIIRAEQIRYMAKFLTILMSYSTLHDELYFQDFPQSSQRTISNINVSDDMISHTKTKFINELDYRKVPCGSLQFTDPNSIQPYDPFSYTYVAVRYSTGPSNDNNSKPKIVVVLIGMTETTENKTKHGGFVSNISNLASKGNYFIIPSDIVYCTINDLYGVVTFTLSQEQTTQQQTTQQQTTQEQTTYTFVNENANVFTMIDALRAFGQSTESTITKTTKGISSFLAIMKLLSDISMLGIFLIDTDMVQNFYKGPKIFITWWDFVWDSNNQPR